MPELPEVESFRQYMDSTSLGQAIRGVEVKNSLILEDITAEQLSTELRGKEFQNTVRHGKFLFAKAQELFLVFHFGMTGFFNYLKWSEVVPNHSRLFIDFDNENRLVYVSQRMLGRVALTQSVEQYVKKKGLGPDALDMGFGSFKEQVKNRTGRVKYVLMNQKIIAGIGNIYSDEILYQTGIHPLTKFNELDGRTVKMLFDTLKKVLRVVIDKKAHLDELPSTYLIPHRYKGGMCPSCGDHLKTLNFSGRTSYYCPKDQQEL
ncbi:MAG: DNA-formamidopyrimidine glycosylase family protein [Archaeoglobaceae archaeon]